LNGDLIGLLTWPSPDTLLLVDGAGKVMTSTNGGVKFEKTGSIGSTPEALGSGEGKILASVDGGKILASTDAGSTWDTAVQPD
jgi:photosystem II stability/assembly factor-like uncharacterized protein